MIYFTTIVRTSEDLAIGYLNFDIFLALVVIIIVIKNFWKTLGRQEFKDGPHNKESFLNINSTELLNM